MLRADLKGLSISDDIVSEDGKMCAHTPFNVPVHLTVGIEGSEGGDIFVSSICNIMWLEREITRARILIETKTFIVGNFSLQEIESVVRELVNSITSNDWNGIVARLSEFSSWEFAN